MSSNISYLGHNQNLLLNENDMSNIEIDSHFLKENENISNSKSFISKKKKKKNQRQLMNLECEKSLSLSDSFSNKSYKSNEGLGEDYLKNEFDDINYETNKNEKDLMDYVVANTKSNIQNNFVYNNQIKSIPIQNNILYQSNLYNYSNKANLNIPYKPTISQNNSEKGNKNDLPLSNYLTNKIKIVKNMNNKLNKDLIIDSYSVYIPKDNNYINSINDIKENLYKEAFNKGYDYGYMQGINYYMNKYINNENIKLENTESIQLLRGTILKTMIDSSINTYNKELTIKSNGTMTEIFNNHKITSSLKFDILIKKKRESNFGISHLPGIEILIKDKIIMSRNERNENLPKAYIPPLVKNRKISNYYNRVIEAFRFSILNIKYTKKNLNSLSSGMNNLNHVRLYSFNPKLTQIEKVEMIFLKAEPKKKYSVQIQTEHIDILDNYEDYSNKETDIIMPEMLSQEQTFNIFMNFVDNLVNEGDCYIKYIDNEVYYKLRKFLDNINERNKKNNKNNNNIISLNESIQSRIIPESIAMSMTVSEYKNRKLSNTIEDNSKYNNRSILNNKDNINISENYKIHEERNQIKKRNKIKNDNEIDFMTIRNENDTENLEKTMIKDYTYDYLIEMQNMNNINKTNSSVIINAKSDNSLNKVNQIKIYKNQKQEIENKVNNHKLKEKEKLKINSKLNCPFDHPLNSILYEKYQYLKMQNRGNPSKKSLNN